MNDCTHDVMGSLGRKDGKWICKECGGMDICSLCGEKETNLVTNLYDLEYEQICPSCLAEEKPISDYMEKWKVDYSDRDYVRQLLEFEKYKEKNKTLRKETLRDAAEVAAKHFIRLIPPMTMTTKDTFLQGFKFLYEKDLAKAILDLEKSDE